MHKLCKAPFFTAEIFESGNVFLCCPSYTKLEAIGNIFKQDWDEIWNCPEAQNFREKIKKGDYSDCNTNFCSPNFFPFCHEVAYINPEKLDIENPKARIIKFSMDKSCNVACTICRDKVYCNEPSKVEKLDSKIEEYLLPILKDAEIVNFTGSGDPFASKHHRNFITRITQEYPHMKFDFHTNGVLCDERNLTELGVIDKLSTIQISLHSATKETYDKIVKFGNWERLNKNLEFLTGLMDQNKLNELQLNFVILSENYKDIPAFIDLCKKYRAKAFLWQYRDIHGVYDYDSVNICSPLHRDHKDFVEIMANLDLSNENLYISPLLKKYTQIKNVEEYYLYASIFANQVAERYETKNSIFYKTFKNTEDNIKLLKNDLRGRIQQLQNLLVVKKATFIEKIFSVKNENHGDYKHKVIRLLGLKLKFKVNK